MARKKNRLEAEDLKEIGEMLDALQKLMDRTKVLYEQYFMGIQKIPPAQLHRDIERKIRELTQQNIRNTALRFRTTNITQKFGVYNTYWRRTLRQIEQGKYVRDVARAQRRAARRGEELPEEILAAMPKRMRDRVLRDREQLANRAAREAEHAEAAGTVRDQRPAAHSVDADMLEDDFDIDALFRNLTSEAESALDALDAQPAPATPAAVAASPVPASAPPASAPPASRPATSPRALSAAEAAVPGEVASETDTTLPFQHKRGLLEPLEPLPHRRRTPAPVLASDEAAAKQVTKPPPVVLQPDAPRRKRASTVPPPPPPEASARPRKRARTSVPPPLPPGAGKPPPLPPGAGKPPPLPPGAGKSPARASGKPPPRPPRKPAARPPRPPLQPARPAGAKNLPPGMTEAKTRALYQRYLSARKRVGKSTDIRYDDLVKTLNRQAPALLKQHKAKAVEFDVMVKGGKVILKAMPKS